MKRIILVLLLSFTSFGLIAAGKKPVAERKKTLVIATINSGLPTIYNLDQDINTPVASKLQKWIKNLNQSSNYVEYDLLLLIGDEYHDEKFAPYLMQQPKIRDQIMKTDEILFLGLDHSNFSYYMIEFILKENPKIKVPLAYSSGCFDLAKSEKWHERTKTPYFIGHIGLSFSPFIYNSLIRDLLEDYADHGHFNKTQLQNRIRQSNQEMAFNLRVHREWLETISDQLMRMIGNRPEYDLKSMTQKFGVDPNNQQIEIEKLNEPLSALERAENQTQAYLSTFEKPITLK